MPSKSETKEIYFAVLNDDGTYGTPVLIRPMKETDLYADSDDEE